MPNGDRRDLACPRCAGVALDVVDAGGHEIDLCSSCRGMWLDAHEWGGVIGPSASPSRLAALATTAADPPPCPACALSLPDARILLQPRMIIGADDVVLDACPSCHGAWLDPGELARLRQALAATRARAAPPPVKKRSMLAALKDGASPDASHLAAAGYAVATGAGALLLALAQAAVTPRRRRGLFGMRRRRRSLGGSLGLLGIVLRLLRR